jgi:adenosine deaminase
VLPLNEELLATVRKMPKIELHRHLEGSVRLQTLVDIAQEHGMETDNIESIRPFVQMMPDEVRDSKHFLAKFMTLRQFYRSEDIVRRITREVIEDAALDNIRYMELRFTPKALCNFNQFPMSHMVQLVCETANQTAQEHGIQVRYIVSMNRHESVELGEQALEAALKNTDKGVVGIDLAGDEANHSALPFRELFKKAKANGMFVTVHAGEWSGASSVWDAVGNLKADRVGHGIKVLEDPAMMNVLIEREIALEICPTSNYLSGIVASLEAHPIVELTRHSVTTTINTDDPSVCNITLSEEIVQMMQHADVSMGEIHQYMLRAARSTFLSRSEKEMLVRQFQNAYSPQPA